MDWPYLEPSLFRDMTFSETGLKRCLIFAAVEPQAVMTALNKALTLVQNYTINTLGQNTVFPGATVCNGNTSAAIQSNTLAACRNPNLVASAYKTTFP